MCISNIATQRKGNSWYLGLDLGKRQDFTAIATLSCEWTRTPRLILRDIDRFPLGTTWLYYPAAIEQRLTHIQGVVAAENNSASPVVSLAIDASGPGGPIVEQFYRAKLDLAIRPHLITGGRHPSTTPAGDATVPRKVLLSTLILLIDKGRLTVPPQIDRWKLLLDELLDLSAATSHPSKSSAHDDMVMALALAAWQAVEEIPALMPERRNFKMHWNPNRRLY